MGILSAEPVGNYGVRYNGAITILRQMSFSCGMFLSFFLVFNFGWFIRLLFDDLHKTGIFTWDYFYHLGSNKFTMMRNYITTLKKHGLSRDPLKRK